MGFSRQEYWSGVASPSPELTRGSTNTDEDKVLYIREYVLVEICLAVPASPVFVCLFLLLFPIFWEVGDRGSCCDLCQSVLSMFSSRSFIVSGLTFRSFIHWRRKWQPTPVFLPGESRGRGSLVGCRLWGRTESDTTEATQQQHT